MKSSMKYFLISVILILVCFLLIPLIFFYESSPSTSVDTGSDGHSIPDDEDSRREDRKLVCQDYYFPCEESFAQNRTNVCIPRSLHCNKQVDCPNGEDEKNCGYILFDLISKYKSGSESTNMSKYHNNFYGNCSLYDLINGSCSCDFDHGEKADCKQQGFTRIPEFFQKSITSLNLERNSIDFIDSHVINTYVNLTIISLRYNRIQRIGNLTFRHLRKLTRLYLRGNQISQVDEMAFYGLDSLTHLYINDNRLKVLDPSVLVYCPKVRLVDVAQNGLTFEEDDQFPPLQHLDWIDLSENRLTFVSAKLFSNLINVTKIHLHENRISRIDQKSFENNRKLLEVTLNDNNLNDLPSSLFSGLVRLSNLDLSTNPEISQLPVTLFADLRSLRSLNLTGVRIININKYHFSENRNLSHLYFSHFKYCLFAPQVRICHPSSDGVSSLEHLLVYPILRISVWIVAFFTCFGNFTVITWRSVSTNEDPVLSLFVKNLSLADLMMGVYLISLGINDIGFQDEYLLHALDWMSSWKCTCVGFMAMISSELSVMILTIVAIERYRSIAFNSRLLTASSARILVGICWVISLAIAGYPLINGPTGLGEVGYYGSNGLCFPLHIDDPFAKGWTYSAFVFLGLNLIAVIVMLVLYIKMFTILNSDRKTSVPGHVDKHREDMILAVRFFFIVFTDCLCWLPIVIIKVIAFTSASAISPTIYAWVVVFILPINSALNPILYTIAAPTEIRRNIHKFLSATLWTPIRTHIVTYRRARTESATTTTEEIKRPSNGSLMSVVTMTTLKQATSSPISRRNSVGKNLLSQMSCETSMSVGDGSVSGPATSFL